MFGLCAGDKFPGRETEDCNGGDEVEKCRRLSCTVLRIAETIWNLRMVSEEVLGVDSRK